MEGWRVLLLALALTGCATQPVFYLPVSTPALTSAQIATLQRRRQTSEALGIRIFNTASGIHAQGINQLQGSERVTIPLLSVPSASADGRFRVPIVALTVNNVKNVRLLLDSGSNQNLIGYTLANRLKLPLIDGFKPLTVTGIGGTIETYASVIPTLRAESLELRNLIAFVAPDALSLHYSRNILDSGQVMILGINAMRIFSYVTIDYENGHVTLAPNETFQPSQSAALVTSVPLRWENGLPVVDLKVDGKHHLSCIVDTGGAFGLFVTRAQAQAMGHWRPGSGALGKSRGVGGDTPSVDYTINLVTVGNANFLKVPARYHLFGDEISGALGLVGSEILRHHKVTFDFRNNLLWLER